MRRAPKLLVLVRLVLRCSSAAYSASCTVGRATILTRLSSAETSCTSRVCLLGSFPHWVCNMDSLGLRYRRSGAVGVGGASIANSYSTRSRRRHQLAYKLKSNSIRPIVPKVSHHTHNGSSDRRIRSRRRAYALHQASQAAHVPRTRLRSRRQRNARCSGEL